ncbi:hypothetical protein D3C86_1564780 [compost metagenome]
MKALEAGAKMVQDTTPAKQLGLYLDGFHNYKRQADLPAEKQHQMRVSHYCQMVNGDFIQCAVFDGNTKEAHLIGIEYIVSDKLFRSMPEDERRYWHPHDGEVDSGMLILPGVPEPAQKEFLAIARTTHGKTWHVWDTHAQALPFGDPSLMWAIDPKRINQATSQAMEGRKRNAAF